MTDLVKIDPFRNLFSFPRWDDFDFHQTQRGMKIHETDKDLFIEAVVAGVPSKDVEVHIEDGVLTIKAERVDENKDTYKTYQYYYTVALSGGQWDKAQAEIEDGVLQVKIPKTHAAQPRKISVKTKQKK